MKNNKKKVVQKNHTVARALGYFSIALGLVEIFAPGRLARLIGVEDKHRDLLRGMGVREIVSGVGILAHKDPSVWMRARVGGDLLDLTLLALAFKTDKVQPRRLMAAMSSVAGMTAADVVCSQRLTRHLDEAEA